MNRIRVVGNSGSGKTTFSAEFAAILKIPHIELDALHHQPNWEKPETGKFLSDVEQATKSDRWIVDGNYSTASEILWRKADTLIFLDLPLRLALYRSTRRSLTRIFTKEILWNGNRETWSALFSFNREKNLLLWTLTNYKERRKLYLSSELLEFNPNLKVIHLTSTTEVANFLETIRKDL